MQTAVIASSILTLLISWLLKSHFERYFHVFKLKTEYKFEQQKKLKDALAMHKSSLIKTAEELNYRLWNFTENISKNWHKIDKAKWTDDSRYYIQSFVYRFLLFFNVICKIEDKIIYIDTTVSSKEDFIYLKYLKVLQHVFCDVMLFNGLNYDTKEATSHFYRDEFKICTTYLNEKEKTLSFSDFRKKIKDESDDADMWRKYISNIDNDPNNLNLCIIQLFHLILLSFLNIFGYDYQYTDKEKMCNLINKYKNNILIKNFKTFLVRNKVVLKM